MAKCECNCDCSWYLIAIVGIVAVIGIVLMVSGKYSCAGTEAEEKLVAEEGASDLSGMAIIPGSTTQLSLVCDDLKTGLTLKKGINKFKWPIDCTEPSVEELFGSIMQNMNLVFDNTANAFYMPAGSSYESLKPQFQAKYKALAIIKKGNTYTLYMKQQSVLTFSGTVPGTSTVCQQFGYVLSYDYNSDGIFDENDINFHLQVVMKKQTCPTNKICDLNNDKSVNIVDNQKLAVEKSNCLKGVFKDCPKVYIESKCGWNSTFNMYTYNKVYYKHDCMPGIVPEGMSFCGPEKEACNDAKGCCSLSFVKAWCDGAVYYNQTQSSCTGEMVEKQKDCSLVKNWYTKQPNTCIVNGNYFGCSADCAEGDVSYTCGFNSQTNTYEYYKLTCSWQYSDLYRWDKVYPYVTSSTCPEGSTCYNPEGKCQ